MTLGTRAAALDRLAGGEGWDLVVVGGGITGAGVLREAARRGLKAVLIEQRDFSWGTSSRSSKMVHGGLRYIAQGDFRLTRDALHERERLLREAPGLVERMGYIFPVRAGQFPGRLSFTALLALYDRFAGIRDHRWMDAVELSGRVPGIAPRALKGACYYTDAVTDDSRLVLRVLQDAVADGGVAVNYVRAAGLLRADGRVCGIEAEDVETGRQFVLRAKAVVNATGAWADRLRNVLVSEKRVRPLRGSHIVVPHDRLPVRDALTLLHPQDRRPVFVFPWEGMTVVGTTDLDHQVPLDEEASITRQECEYLYDAVASQFDGTRLSDADVVSTWSGVRPVIAGDKARDPSKERRDHAVWYNDGLVTVSGGKLTTFRLIALDALRAAAPALGVAKHFLADHGDAIFAHRARADALDRLPLQRRRVLGGRYGVALADYVALPGACDDTRDAWTLADARHALVHEQVVHLDDLLLRRTRLGNIQPAGAAAQLPLLQADVQRALGWDAARWEAEVRRYQDIHARHYALPA